MNQKTNIFLMVAASFIIGMWTHSIWSSAKAAAIRSNRFALETSLKEELGAYRKTHGVYPKSLDEVEVDWLKDPERRNTLLVPFYYENRGDSYILWWSQNQKD